MLALYEDQATVIWPGLGEVAHGKVEIEKLAATLCKSGQPGPKLKSQNSKQLAPDYIVNVGMWDLTATGPDGKPVTSKGMNTGGRCSIWWTGYCTGLLSLDTGGRDSLELENRQG